MIQKAKLKKLASTADKLDAMIANTAIGLCMGIYQGIIVGGIVMLIGMFMGNYEFAWYGGLGIGIVTWLLSTISWALRKF